MASLAACVASRARRSALADVHDHPLAGSGSRSLARPAATTAAIGSGGERQRTRPGRITGHRSLSASNGPTAVALGGAHRLVGHSDRRAGACRQRPVGRCCRTHPVPRRIRPKFRRGGSVRSARDGARWRRLRGPPAMASPHHRTEATLRRGPVVWSSAQSAGPAVCGSR